MSHRTRRANFIPQRIAAARPVPSVPAAPASTLSPLAMLAFALFATPINMIAASTRRIEMGQDYDRTQRWLHRE